MKKRVKCSHAPPPQHQRAENGNRLALAPAGGRSSPLPLRSNRRLHPLPRRRFLWRAGSALRLRARVSAPDLPGTWGFGFWNDPFSFALGLGGMRAAAARFAELCVVLLRLARKSPVVSRRLARQRLAGANVCCTAHSLRSAGPGLLGLPFLLFRPLSRWLRAHAAAKLIREDSQRLQVDVTAWHTYRLAWDERRVAFFVDDEPVFETNISPPGPLGLVLWIDNQFAAWRPDGTLTAGVLPNPPAWMEMAEISAG